MRIGELSVRTGVPTETIRYYEKVGLLPRPKRRDNQYRVYHEHDVHRLGLIKRCRHLGMSMESIAELLSVMDGSNPDPNEVHALLNQHIATIDAQIRQWRALKAELMALHDLCHGDHAVGETCPLYEALDCGCESHACANKHG